jgi:hypothetical protein
MDNYKLLKGYRNRKIKYRNHTLFINPDLGGPLIYLTLLYSSRPDLLIEQSFTRAFETDKPISDILTIGEIALKEYVDMGKQPLDVFESTLEILKQYIELEHV